MKLKQKHIDEQDYYLNFRDRYHALVPVTIEHRKEFLEWDTNGGPANPDNPIVLSKYRYGQTGSLLTDPKLYELEGWWGGGLDLSWDYWNSNCGLRPLLEWFGPENVAKWVSAFQYTYEKPTK